LHKQAGLDAAIDMTALEPHLLGKALFTWVPSHL